MASLTKQWAIGISIFAMLMGAWPVPVAAADAPHWLAALGVSVRPDYEGSEDQIAYPALLAELWWDDGRYVAVQGPRNSGEATRLHANFLPDSYLELGPVLQVRIGRDEVDQRAVDSLPDVGSAVELGAFAALSFAEDHLKLSTTGVMDVSAEHEGGIIELALDSFFDMGATVSVSAGIVSNWASADYMSAYFGISPVVAAGSTLAAFDADGGFKDVGLRLSAMWNAPRWEHLRFIGEASAFRLLGDAEDSPIVAVAGKDVQIYASLMIGWEY